MRRFIVALTFAGLLALGACSTSPNDQMANVYAMEMAPTAAEIGYANLATHDPAVLKQLDAYRQRAWAAVQEIQTELKADPKLNVYQSAGYSALVTALAELNAYEQAHHIQGAK